MMEYYHITKDNFFSGDEGQHNQKYPFEQSRSMKHKTRKWTPDRDFLTKDRKNFRDRKTPEKHKPFRESNCFSSSHCDNDDNSFSSIWVDNRYLLGVDRGAIREERNRSEHMKKEQFMTFSDYDGDYTSNRVLQENFANNHPAYENLEIKHNIEWNSDEFFHGKNKDIFPYEKTTVQIIKDQVFDPNSFLNCDHTRGKASHQNDIQIQDTAFNKQEIDRDFYTKLNHNIKKRLEKPLQNTAIPVWDISPVDTLVITPDVIADNYIEDVSLSNMGVINSSSTLLNMSVGKFADNFGMMNGQGNLIPDTVLKNPIILPKCTLYPPNSKDSVPTITNKPLGCKTVLVQGLPPKATEKIIREVFEHCGKILSLRLSKVKDNCCYITFASESFVENAIYLSGYKMHVKNKLGYDSEFPYSGQLYVDYVLSNDDQYEYKMGLKDNFCKISKIDERLADTSSAVYYSRRKALALGEKLRKKETFHEAVNILSTWLEKGQCDKKNSCCFYSMIQSINSYIWRLMNERKQSENELVATKLKLKQILQDNLQEVKNICKVYDKASLQKVWAHFTKPQRKNIILWKKQVEEIKNSYIKVLLNERVEDDMDVSDSEEKVDTNVDNTSTTLKVNDNLQEENRTLHCKLEIAENELLALQSKLQLQAQELDRKNCYIQSLEQKLKAKEKDCTEV